MLRCRAIFRSHFRCCPTLRATVFFDLRIVILNLDSYIEVDDLQAISTVANKVSGLDITMGDVVLVKIGEPFDQAPAKCGTSDEVNVIHESLSERDHLWQNEPLPGSRRDGFDRGDDVWRVRPSRTEEIEDVWLSRSFAHELCNLLGLVRIVPSIYDANVRWWLRENSQCNIIDGEMVFMAYLVEQFPSAALCLQDMWYNLISARLQLFRFAAATTLRVIILGVLVFASISPSIIVGTLRFSSERRQVETFIENDLEISDLGFYASFVAILRVQFRSEIV